MNRVYEEIVEFIAAGTTTDSVVQFEASQEVKDRVAELIHRAKTGKLSSDEISELNHFMQLEHIMRLAKARAHGH
ncbi:MAG: hypothetical protein R3F37_13800 [Candidatus Competibacteraceae bacterium]